MKKIMLSILVFLSLIACKKDTNDDLSGNLELSGKIYVQNIYDSSLKTLLPNHDIFIRKDLSPDATSFLFSTKSDTNGNFVFKYLFDQYYAVHAEMRMNTRLDQNILFTSLSPVIKPGNNIELIVGPDFNTQNGVYVICRDTVTFPGTIPGALPGTIPGDSIYIYTSRVLAINDIAINGTGAAYRFTARNTGSALKMNLPPIQRLYVKAACTFGSIRLKNDLDSIELRQTSLDTLIIHGKL